MVTHLSSHNGTKLELSTQETEYFREYIEDDIPDALGTIETGGGRGSPDVEQV